MDGSAVRFCLARQESGAMGGSVWEDLQFAGFHTYSGGHPRTEQAGGLPYNVAATPDLRIGRRVKDN